MLTLEIKPGESVKIGNVAVITLREKSGKVARLSIEADKSVPIERVRPATPAQIAAKNGLAAQPV